MNHYGLRSLLQLLQIKAPYYVRIGQMYENYLRSVRAVSTHPDIRPDAEQYREMLTTLHNLHELCVDTGLVVSAKTLDRTIEEFEREAPTFRNTQQGLDVWFNCFVSELDTQVFCVVSPHRTAYFPSGTIGTRLSRSVATGFPEAQYDAFEAGHCFAFARFSACVYHLMRLAEHGLVSVAASLNVPEEKLAKGWDGCIQGIEAAIKVISSTKPTSDWQDQVKKYSDLSAWFTTIKTGWRNPSSHVPRIYSEDSASGMFSAVCALFEHLSAYGFKQTTMPSDPLPLPGVPVVRDQRP